MFIMSFLVMSLLYTIATVLSRAIRLFCEVFCMFLIVLFSCSLLYIIGIFAMGSLDIFSNLAKYFTSIAPDDTDAPVKLGSFIISFSCIEYLRITGGGADIARKPKHKTGHLILKNFAVELIKLAVSPSVFKRRIGDLNP